MCLMNQGMALSFQLTQYKRLATRARCPISVCTTILLIICRTDMIYSNRWTQSSFVIFLLFWFAEKARGGYRFWRKEKAWIWRRWNDKKAGLHNLFHPTIQDGSTWSKFGARGERGDVFPFSNLDAFWFSENRATVLGASLHLLMFK